MKTKQKTIIYVLFAACVLLLVHAPLFAWWCGTGIGKFLNGINAACFYDTIALLFVMLGCGAAIEIPELLSETGNTWGRALSGWLVLVLVIESVAFDERFVHFYTLPWLRYTDVLIPILTTFWIASWFETKKEGEHAETHNMLNKNLYYDDVDEVDFLGRSDLVGHICKHLKENSGNRYGATGVAICGGWGTGKSWILTHIKKQFQAEGEICIDFKPWIYGDVDVTRLFYQTLGRQLKANGLRIEELSQAVTEIDNDELVGFGRAFLSLFGVVTKRDSREHTIEQIKKRLNEYHRSIHIFIDDCDRLQKKELLQVLSLIRNTGGFPHLTYILAFDKEIVKKLIEDEQGLGYVDKMINLSIELPPITDETVSAYLLSAAKEITGYEENITNPFERVPITQYLPTVREAKRYLNLLSSDFKREEGKFGRFHVNMGDCFLLELLKYKMPEFYYRLKMTPEKYLEQNKTGWNSPSWLPKKDSFEESNEVLTLLKAIFREVMDPNDHYGMIGVANKEYFPLYFEGTSDQKYVDGDEFIDALNNEAVPRKIGKWVSDGYAGVLGLLCIAQGYLSRKELFLAMAEYIWNQCENSKVVNSLGQLTFGYDKAHYRHSYKQIEKLIAETPQIHLLTFQNIDKEDDGSESEELTNYIGLGLEMMGIWMNELRHAKNLDYPYMEVKENIKRLWKKLIARIGDRDIDTLNMIDICGDCTDEGTFEEMVLPMVCDNPKRWLGATVIKLDDSEKHYYLLKSKATHALFGRQEKVAQEMKAIKACVKDEDKEYVEAYEHLMNRIAAMTINNKDSVIPGKYKKADCIEREKLSALDESKFIGISLVMPIGQAIVQLRKTSFWRDENIRIYRGEVNFYYSGI